MATKDPRPDEHAGNELTGEALRGLEELAERLEALAARGPLGRRMGLADARIAAAAARHLRAIPKALAAGMEEAFAVGREYGHREVQLADHVLEATALATTLARRAWGGGKPGHA